MVDRVAPMENLDTLIAQSDFILLAIPLDSSTTGLISAERIGKMKPTAMIINVARGALIDEKALYEACRDGRIGGAAIDTWYQYPAQGELLREPSTLPFRDLDNVIMTPHGSGWTEGLLPSAASSLRKTWIALRVANRSRMSFAHPLLTG
jgi:phosphoglycerate dehydrogenase-like enzyme